jgi:hypothetical protein
MGLQPGFNAVTIPQIVVHRNINIATHHKTFATTLSH